MPSSTFYNEVLTDHNLYPAHKKPLPGANMTLEGVNPSCGDDIILQLKVETARLRTAALLVTAARSPRLRQISCWT